MTLQYSNRTPDASAFKSLYDTTGWGPATRPLEFYAASLQGSWTVHGAYDGERLVGFGRVISDGRLHAFVTEMIIHPEYQRRGIGEQIIKALVANCHAAGIRDIQLFCAQGKAGFYLQNGFVNRPEDAPGMQYLT
jgi:GNAT superfamily N-acetyltransferase